MFVGDRPYDTPTPRHKLAYPDDFDLRATHMNLKTESIHDAIANYLPPGSFAIWLEKFVRNLRWEGHQTAVMESLDNMPLQMNLLEPKYQTSAAATRRRLSLKYKEGGDPERCRLALSTCDIRHTAINHRELVLSLALLQGAHAPFIEQLAVAIERASLTESEKDIARFVTRGLLEPFKGFAIFTTMIPLVLLKREEVLQADTANQSPEAIMHAAIGQAWKTFFSKRLLIRIFPDGSRMVCPAYQYLREIRDQHLLEKLYSFVVANRQNPIVSSLCDQSYKVSCHATQNGWQYYWGNRAAALEANKNARGGKGLT